MSGRALSADEFAILAHEVRSPVAALEALSEAAAAVVATNDAASVDTLFSLARAAVDDIVRLCADLDDGVTLGPLRPVSLEEVVLAAGGGELMLPDAVVLGDETRLRQTVRNLLANGNRHGTHVTVRAEAVDGRVAVIEIRDDGPGVPEGIDVFARGVSAAGSTGYGLWVARTIIEAHGGTLELIRDEAPGACFRIELPLASASA